MIYNTIKHDIRNKAGLSMLDYCILEMIYNLSNSGQERYKTWCNASKIKFIHLATKRTIINRFNRILSILPKVLHLLRILLKGIQVIHL